jgi:hypothetical protein
MEIPQGFENFYPKNLCDSFEKGTVWDKTGSQSILDRTIGGT